MSEHATPESSQESGLGALVQEYLDAQYEVPVAGERALREGHGDVIHVTRVAARRYRTVLRDFSDLFDSAVAVVLEESLRWYAGVLGGVRDLQVGRSELASLVELLPDNDLSRRARVTLESYLGRREADAVHALNLALDSHRYRWVIEQLTAWHENPPLEDDRRDDEVERYVRRARRRVQRRLDQAADAGNPEGLLHDARKAAKRARYVAELSEPVLGRQARSAVGRMTKVQDVLGARQDQAVARALLRDLAEIDSGGDDGDRSAADLEARDAARAAVELLTALMPDPDEVLRPA